MEPLLLTAKEAAKALGVSASTLYKLSQPRGGPLPVVKVGPRAIRYARQSLVEFIAGFTGGQPA